ncbi:MAG: hypothetical protein JWR18_2524 [Segetibacter sp.]|jgi:hypothetical protein|nr:hypothetical protein [Segetibacter sp.]
MNDAMRSKDERNASQRKFHFITIAGNKKTSCNRASVRISPDIVLTIY